MSLILCLPSAEERGEAGERQSGVVISVSLLCHTEAESGNAHLGKCSRI